MDIEKEEIKVAVFGDYHGGYQHNNKIIEAINSFSDPVYLFGNVYGLIHNVDLSVVNLEYPITNHKESILKYGPPARSKKECLLPLAAAPIDIVTLATNHTADYGDKGINDTIEACETKNIKTVGSGLNLKEAKKPLRLKVKNKSISFLNFAETQFNIATENRGGANPLDIIDNVKSIREEKRYSDYVIVIIHGGGDLVPFPSPEFVKQLRFYAEEGASAIIVHHSRVISLFETYKGVPIFYGLGNFIHYTKRPDNREQVGLGVELIFTDEKISYNLHPIRFDLEKKQLNLLNDEKKQDLLLEISKKNELLNDLTKLKSFWGKYIKKHLELRYLILLSNLPNIVFRVFRKLNILFILRKILLIRKKRFLPVLNIIQNDSHIENAKYILNEIFKKNN